VLPRLEWGAIALWLVAAAGLALSAKATQEAVNRYSYYDACLDTAWGTPFVFSVVFGALALALSIAWVVTVRKQRRRGQTLFASIACVMCVAGGLGAGFLALAHFCM
jgi:uncharacterized membrane protein